MKNKIIIFLLLFALFVSADIFMSDKILFAQDGISIEDIREKKGGNLQNTAAVEKSFEKNVINIIANQKIQFLINVAVILLIILLIVRIKSKGWAIKKNEQQKSFSIKVEGEIDYNKKDITPDKPALIEMIEKAFFPFFRRDIGAINSQLVVMKKIQDKIKEEQATIKEEQATIKEEQATMKEDISRIANSHDVTSCHINNLSEHMIKLEPLRQVNIIPRDVNKYAVGLLHRYYYNIADIEKEFYAFNHIPIETIAEYIAKEGDVVAVGNFANILIKFLGKGRSIKVFLGVTDSITTDGETLCPPALLPYNFKKTDYFISTNTDLSMVLIRSANILEILKDKIDEAFIFVTEFSIIPINIKWVNFAGLEIDNNNYKRWAINFVEDSHLELYCNIADGSDIELMYDIFSPNAGSSVNISGCGLSEKILSTGSFIKVNFKVHLKKGKNILQFRYEGNKQKIGNDPRELKFAIINMDIRLPNGNRMGINNVYGDSSNAFESEDSYIRSRLHGVGFFDIDSYLIFNHGYFIKKLPRSKFILFTKHYNFEYIYESIADFISMESMNSIHILYVANRKEKEDINNE